MTKAAFRKRGNTLIAADEHATEVLQKIKENRDVIVEVRQARNVRHLRLYWAIIKFLKMHAVDKRGNSLFRTADEEVIHFAIKLATGFVRTFVDVDTGKSVYVPLSISFESIDQIRFAKFFDAACAAIAERYLPEGTTPDDVRKELLEMIGEPYGY